MRATLALLLAFLAAASWSWWQGRQQRALLELAPPERLEIYRHAIADMEALCSSPGTDEAFAARCGQQALFLSQFPECGPDCRRVIEPYLPKPSR